MTGSSDLRLTRIPLNNGSGHMPALGFGTLIPDPAETITATRARWRPDFDTSIVRSDTGTSSR